MKNLNWMGPINDLGYGVASSKITSALIKSGANVHINPIGQPQGAFAKSEILDAIDKNLHDHQPSWTTIKMWHQHDLITRVANSWYSGFPIFELDTFSDLEKAHLRVPDSLYVCSQWAKNVIMNNVHIPDDYIDVVPLGVDRGVFHEFKYEPNGKYRFYTIGKLEYRKGHDFIVKCFNRAFEKTDDVELNMMVNNPFLSREVMQQWINGFKSTKLGDKINFEPPVREQSQVAAFIHKNDCGLFPSRAEGWNLELLESMSCGKQVIATDYSAHTEYCHKDNCNLIEVTDLEDAYDQMGGMWFRGQGKWAELEYEQEEQMVSHMRKCFFDRKNNEGGITTAKKYSWEHSANCILETIEDVK
jgi:glycosyltransferase involved in cell wall biosynthesis